MNAMNLLWAAKKKDKGTMRPIAFCRKRRKVKERDSKGRRYRTDCLRLCHAENPRKKGEGEAIREKCHWGKRKED